MTLIDKNIAQYKFWGCWKLETKLKTKLEHVLINLNKKHKNIFRYIFNTREQWNLSST